MYKVNRDIGEHEDLGAVVDWSGEIEGYKINFVTFREDVDATPLYKGLPDDRCQCPHWGYVTNGRVTFRIGDEEVVFEEGDAFYTPPGHVPIKHEPGTEFVIFSPVHEMAETEEAMRRNAAALQS